MHVYGSNDAKTLVSATRLRQPLNASALPKGQFMKITRERWDPNNPKWKEWHALIVGEWGFSMLDIYGSSRGLNADVLQEFAARINKDDKFGTLHPIASISAIPRRYLRGQKDDRDLAVMTDFRRLITDFLEANRRGIYASKILVDFHVNDEPVPLRYIEAVEELFRLAGQDNPVAEVVVIT